MRSCHLVKLPDGVRQPQGGRGRLLCQPEPLPAKPRRTRTERTCPRRGSELCEWTVVCDISRLCNPAKFTLRRLTCVERKFCLGGVKSLAYEIYKRRSGVSELGRQSWTTFALLPPHIYDLPVEQFPFAYGCTEGTVDSGKGSYDNFDIGLPVIVGRVIPRQDPFADCLRSAAKKIEKEFPMRACTIGGQTLLRDDHLELRLPIEFTDDRLRQLKRLQGCYGRPGFAPISRIPQLLLYRPNIEYSINGVVNTSERLAHGANPILARADAILTGIRSKPCKSPKNAASPTCQQRALLPID